MTTTATKAEQAEAERRELALVQTDLRLAQLEDKRLRLERATQQVKTWRRTILEQDWRGTGHVSYIEQVVVHLDDAQRVGVPSTAAQRDELAYWQARRRGDLDAHEKLWMAVRQGRLLGPFFSLEHAKKGAGADCGFFTQVGYEALWQS